MKHTQIGLQNISFGYESPLPNTFTLWTEHVSLISDFFLHHSLPIHFEQHLILSAEAAQTVGKFIGSPPAGSTCAVMHLVFDMITMPQ